MRLSCAGGLLALGLLGASQVGAHERETPAAARPSADAKANAIRQQVDARPSADAIPTLRPILATTRPAVVLDLIDRPTQNVVIDGKVVELAAHRLPAERTSVAPVELMRTIPAESSPAPRPVAVAVAVTPKKAARARVVRMEVTAYCPCTKCCGPNAAGVTASGLPVSHNGGKFVAADTSVLPFRTKLAIPGYHAAAPVEVIDRGGAIKGRRLDVYFPTHAEALEWGRRIVDVSVAME